MDQLLALAGIKHWLLKDQLNLIIGTTWQENFWGKYFRVYQ